jgi:hypothetical protein
MTPKWALLLVAFALGCGGNNSAPAASAGPTQVSGDGTTTSSGLQSWVQAKPPSPESPSAFITRAG